MHFACRRQAENTSLFMLYIDEEPWREIHASIFGKNPAFPSSFTSFEEFKEFKENFFEQEYIFAKRYAYKRVALKNQSSIELSQHLAEKQVSAETIHKVIAHLSELGYCNDVEWLENFIRQQKVRKQGPAAIKAKLRAKGIPETSIASSLEEIADPEAQQAGLAALLRTRYKKHNLADFATRQKVTAALLRKGFELSAVKAAVQAARLSQCADS